MQNPFTREDGKKLDELLAAIEVAKKEITRAKLAKIDVSAAEQRILASEEKLRALKQVYFAPTVKPKR